MKSTFTKLLAFAFGTFREFPPSQKVGTFSLDAVLQALQTPGRSN